SPRSSGPAISNPWPIQPTQPSCFARAAPSAVMTPASVVCQCVIALAPPPGGPRARELKALTFPPELSTGHESRESRPQLSGSGTCLEPQGLCSPAPPVPGRVRAAASPHHTADEVENKHRPVQNDQN